MHVEFIATFTLFEIERLQQVVTSLNSQIEALV